MNKTIARCAIISGIAVWLILSLAAPWVLSDKNSFLKNFVNHELLNFLGVVVTITLASAANLHLELNKFEERVKRVVFPNTRCAIKSSAYWLLGMLTFSFFLIIAKPLVIGNKEQLIAESLFNGAAILIVLFNVLVLADLIQTAFKLEPDFDS